MLDVDDLLGQLFGEAVFGRLSRSRRAQLLARLLIGLIGAGLGTAGAVHFMTRDDLTTNVALRGSMAGVFVFLACFALFNVALGRRWRWPGLGFIGCFVAMFVVRLATGP